NVLELLSQFRIDRLRTATLRIPGAGQERAAPRRLHDHRLAALLAVDARIRGLDRRAVLFAVGDERALRVRALHVLLPRLALLQEQVVFLAARALVLGRQRGDGDLA